MPAAAAPRPPAAEEARSPRGKRCPAAILAAVGAAAFNSFPAPPARAGGRLGALLGSGRGVRGFPGPATVSGGGGGEGPARPAPARHLWSAARTGGAGMRGAVYRAGGVRST